MEPIQYFDPTGDNIKLLKKLMKKQGFDTCRQQISQEWIDTSIAEHSFGYAYITPRAQTGRRSVKKEEDRYSASGFILCRLENSRKAWIDLVCGKKSSQVGKLLVEMVEEHCRQNGVILIQLYALPIWAMIFQRQECSTRGNPKRILYRNFSCERVSIVGLKDIMCV
jgi:hypothetical protein